MREFSIVILFVGFSHGLVARPGDFEVGRPSPNLYLTELKYYPVTQLSLHELNGKVIVLCFWSLACKGAVTALPQWNAIQARFKDDVQVILITTKDKSTMKVYEQFRRHYSMNLPICYDSELFTKTGVQTVPRMVIIDRDGIVQAITASVSVNEMDLFLKGRPVKWMNYRTDHIYIDYTKPLFVGGNGGSDSSFLFRSVLTQWEPELGMRWYDFQKAKSFEYTHWSARSKRGVQIVGADLAFLYRIAYAGSSYFRPGDSVYYGHIWPHPLLPRKDSLLYVPDYRTGQNIYCYSLQIPPERATDSSLQEIMRSDLQNYFGFKATMEKREMPCWKLTATDNAAIRLKAKGKATYYLTDVAAGSAGMKLKNITIGALIEEIWSYHQNEPPFIDATGIQGKIDIELDAVMVDLPDIKAALSKNGLELKKETCEMKVIVLKNQNDPD